MKQTSFPQNTSSCPETPTIPVTFTPSGPRETVWTRFLSRFLGHKYYANIIYARGSGCTKDGASINGELCCFIFSSRKQSRIHRSWLKHNKSFGYVETVTFRSHKSYARWNYEKMRHFNNSEPQ